MQVASGSLIHKFFKAWFIMACMIELAYTPVWFHGKDMAIDVMSALVVSLLALFTFRYYRLSRSRSYVFLSAGFALIALAFFAKVLTNFTLYYTETETTRFGDLLLTYTQVQSSNLLLVAGFFLYKLFALLGVYLLYYVYQQRQSATTELLIAYLIVVSALFSAFAYPLFHLTALLLLFLVVKTYLSRYRVSGNRLTLMLAASFSVIASSQLLFLLVAVGWWFYVFAEVVQLLGYLLLLVTFSGVLIRGKKAG
jgi:hypothetical protein